MNSRRVKDIDYELFPGTDRKTTDIVIERNGRVIVRPPKAHSPEQVDAVVERKRMWIYRNLAEWRDLNATAVVREWVNGETFLYLGRTYRLSLIQKQEGDLKLKDGRFYLKREIIETGGSSAAKKVFELFYTEKGLQRFSERVAHFEKMVGVETLNIKVKDLGYRWANCYKDNSLAFHWKCMMAPARIIDYIVVHELCHIHHRNHTDKFWNEVDKVMQDYSERKDWLRKHGAGMDL